MNENIAPERLTIVANNGSSYAAIYVDGRLKERGDFDEILERAIEWVGIDLDFDDGFLRGSSGDDIAPTLDAITEWNDGADERDRIEREAVAAAARREAEEQAADDEAIRARSGDAASKRALAAALLAEADAIENATN